MPLIFPVTISIIFSAPLSQLFKQTLSLSPALSHINNVTKCICVFKSWQDSSVTFLFNNKHKKRGDTVRVKGTACVYDTEMRMIDQWSALLLHLLTWFGPHSSFYFHQCANSPIFPGSQWSRWVQRGTSYVSTFGVTGYLRFYLGVEVIQF